MSTPTSPVLYPTTGEPVEVNARRNRLGVWLCIASDATGTVALLIAYSYLWSLNVNNGWAPPKGAWAPAWPFWAIVSGLVLGTITMWWGVKGISKGHISRLIAAALLSTLLVLAAFLGQIIQLSTFPFGPADGAYASATQWLALATALHLAVVLFLTLAIIGRTRAGRIAPDNHSHARFVAMWMTWVCVAAILGALFATVMTDSPNTNSPSFGTFQE